MQPPPAQTACAGQPPGNQPELIDSDWEEVIFRERTLGGPARRDTGDPMFKRGAALFRESRYDVCHVPELRTAKEVPLLKVAANKLIRPHTDLLLHNMGKDLAAHRPEFRAGGRDWRTQPLRGMGLSQIVSGGTAMLHDGRARNATEAILWQGGEAQASREACRRMKREDRHALLKYPDSI